MIHRKLNWRDDYLDDYNATFLGSLLRVIQRCEAPMRLCVGTKGDGVDYWVERDGEIIAEWVAAGGLSDGVSGLKKRLMEWYEGTGGHIGDDEDVVWRELLGG